MPLFEHSIRTLSCEAQQKYIQQNIILKIYAWISALVASNFQNGLQYLHFNKLYFTSILGNNLRRR